MSDVRGRIRRMSAVLAAGCAAWLAAVEVGVVPSSAASSPPLPGTGPDAGRTVVYRDTWGVPHIYAPTVEAGLFAMGWAQAEDRPEEILKNMLRGMGELASVDGASALDSDTVALMWDLYAGSRAAAERIDPETLRHLQVFSRGINAWFDAHPEDRPAWWGDRRVDAFMVVAFSRLFLQSSSFDDGFRDLIRAGIDPGIELSSRGSNQFVVAAERSAEGAPLLAGDLHLAWDGPYRFWEFRIHAGALEGSGFTLAGVPYIGIGHNGHAAWSMTTGGPDTADGYELTLDTTGENPTRYRYDGAWRPLSTREYRIRVKGGGQRVLRFFDSHHGPLAVIRDGKGYAVRSAYADAVDVNAVWRDYAFAADFRGVEKGLARLQLFPHNAMVADDAGNIFYQRAGRVPRRPEGFDGSRPVDGSTSRTEWLGIHPASDLLQVVNPPQGYMQNCNVPPDAMMEQSPFRPDRTMPYLYADMTQPAVYGHSERGGWTNSRGARAVELLRADDRVSAEEAMAVVNDIRPFSAPRWVALLLEADARFGASHAADSVYAAGIRALRSWDFRLAADSRAALVYAMWRMQLRDDPGAGSLRALARRIDALREPLGESVSRPSPSETEQRGLVDAFARATARIRSDFGTSDATYGEVFRLGCGDRSWPAEGGMAEGLGLTTLRSVGYGDERADHTRRATRGQTSACVVALTRPIRSWTVVPSGQSGRPDSPHACDQAERLFGRRSMKPTWWTPEDLAGHIESRTVLAAAP